MNTLKRQLEVRDKAIKDLEMKLEDKDLFIKREMVSKPMYESTQEHLARQNVENQKLRKELQKHVQDYWIEKNAVVKIDAELENKREQLRQAREEVISLGKELEHLRPLMVLYMKEKVK